MAPPIVFIQLASGIARRAGRTSCSRAGASPGRDGSPPGVAAAVLRGSGGGFEEAKRCERRGVSGTWAAPSLTLGCDSHRRTTVRLLNSKIRCSACHWIARLNTTLSILLPSVVNSSTVIVWSTRSTACSMIGPLIEITVDVVRGCTDQLDPACVRLVVRLRALEARQKRNDGC